MLELRNYGIIYQRVSLLVRFCVSLHPTINVTDQNASNRRDSSASSAIKRDCSTHAKYTQVTPTASVPHVRHQGVFNNNRVLVRLQNTDN